MRRTVRMSISILFVLAVFAGVLYSVTKDVEWKQKNTQDSVTVNTPMTEVAANVKNSVYGIYNITEKGKYSGSGFVYKIDNDKAYLLTNAHVVEATKELRVFFEVGAMVKANLEGKDENFDLAVVSIQASDLPQGAKAISLSETIPALGDDVLAMGTPLDAAFYNTTTAGVISGTSRVFIEKTVKDGAVYFNDFLQLDAAINHGNSGGPLFNQKGEVIGVNARGIAGDTESPVANLAFSIPVYVIKAVLPHIEKGESKPILNLGLVIDGLYDESYGSIVQKENAAGNTVAFVASDSPAQKAGFATGDIITHIDGSSDVSTRAVAQKLLQSTKGTTIEFKVLRSGETKTLSVTLDTEVR